VSAACSCYVVVLGVSFVISLVFEKARVLDLDGQVLVQYFPALYDRSSVLKDLDLLDDEVGCSILAFDGSIDGH